MVFPFWKVLAKSQHAAGTVAEGDCVVEAEAAGAQHGGSAMVRIGPWFGDVILSMAVLGIWCLGGSGGGSPQALHLNSPLNSREISCPQALGASLFQGNIKLMTRAARAAQGWGRDAERLQKIAGEDDYMLMRATDAYWYIHCAIQSLGLREQENYTFNLKS